MTQDSNLAKPLAEDIGRLPPRWHFGCHQIRSGSTAPRDVVRAARRMRDRRIPLDTFLIDDIENHTDGWSHRARARVAEDIEELRIRAFGLVERSDSILLPRHRHDWSSSLTELLHLLSENPSGSLVELSATTAESSAEILRVVETAFLIPFVALRLPFGPGDREFWNLDKESEEHVRRMLELRMELLPYLQTSLRRSLNGGPALLSPGAASDGTWLIGDALLISPGREPGETSRTLQLPSGKWIHYWTDRPYTGDAMIEVEATPGRPPLFFRAGSVVPSEPVRQHSDEVVPSVTFLDVYSNERVSGQLVDCDSAGVILGETAFSGELDYGMLRLEIENSSVRQDHRMMWSVRVHGLGGGIRSVLVDGIPIEAGAGSRVLEFTFRASGAKQVLDVEFDEY